MFKIPVLLFTALFKLLYSSDSGGKRKKEKGNTIFTFLFTRIIYNQSSCQIHRRVIRLILLRSNLVDLPICPSQSAEIGPPANGKYLQLPVPVAFALNANVVVDDREFDATD